MGDFCKDLAYLWLRLAESLSLGSFAEKVPSGLQQTHFQSHEWVKFNILWDFHSSISLPELNNFQPIVEIMLWQLIPNKSPCPVTNGRSEPTSITRDTQVELRGPSLGNCTKRIRRWSWRRRSTTQFEATCNDVTLCRGCICSPTTRCPMRSSSGSRIKLELCDRCRSDWITLISRRLKPSRRSWSIQRSTSWSRWVSGGKWLNRIINKIRNWENSVFIISLSYTL